MSLLVRAFSRGLVLCWTVAVPVFLSGCFFDDGPKIVPAKNGWSGTPAVAQRVPEPQISLSVNRALEGTNVLCASYEAGPLWMAHADRGLFTETRKDGSNRTGLRFELGNPILGNHRTGIQFSKNEEPRLYKRDQSDGASVEMLNDDKTDAPVLRCFKTLPDATIWVEYDLLETAPRLQGSWACEGPLGAMTMNDSGQMTTAQGAAQAFLWTHKRVPFISVFLQAAAPLQGPLKFDRFFEAGLGLNKLGSGEWTYDTTGSDGRMVQNTCRQQAAAAAGKNP